MWFPCFFEAHVEVTWCAHVCPKSKLTVSYSYVPNSELAVTEVYNKLLQNFEEQKHTCAIILGLAKAFDSVNHET